MSTQPVPIESFAQLEPLNALSAQSLRELSLVCEVERIGRGHDPFHLKGLDGQAVYLVKGELRLAYPDGSSEVLVGGTEAASGALGNGRPAFREAKAITNIELLRIDENLLDIMLTWDQVAAAHHAASARLQDAAGETDWRTMSGMYTAQNLAHGALAVLPPAHIAELLGRFERIKAKRGEAIIREGEAGDYYYVIESGRCKVTRQVGGATVELAELKGCDAFGEEALVAEARRNATVTMKTDGVLLRLAKRDFVELLREPLLHRVSPGEAARKVANGAVWLDVRFAAECIADRLPGAINIPLNEIRNVFGSLDRGKEYIVYCQSGRRSSAAAFLLSQRGYKAYLLEGGLRGA